jgi:hypothetical protein
MSADMSDDEESIGSLKDFIVEDTESCGAESSASDSEAAEPKAKKAKVIEDPDLVNQLVTEAKAFVANIQGTTVNGRTLRSRDPKALDARKPKDEYYERFGRDAEQKLLEKFTKKDIIEFVRDLEKENRADYEAAGHTWPKLHAKMSLDAIQDEYQKIKDFLDLPDSDGEESVASEDDDSEAGEEEAEDDADDAESDADEDSDAEDSDADEDSEADDDSDSDEDSVSDAEDAVSGAAPK